MSFLSFVIRKLHSRSASKNVSIDDQQEIIDAGTLSDRFIDTSLDQIDCKGTLSTFDLPANAVRECVPHPALATADCGLNRQPAGDSSSVRPRGSAAQLKFPMV